MIFGMPLKIVLGIVMSLFFVSSVLFGGAINELTDNGDVMLLFVFGFNLAGLGFVLLVACLASNFSNKPRRN